MTVVLTIPRQKAVIHKSIPWTWSRRAGNRLEAVPQRWAGRGSKSCNSSILFLRGLVLLKYCIWHTRCTFLKSSRLNLPAQLRCNWNRWYWTPWNTVIVIIQTKVQGPKCMPIYSTNQRQGNKHTCSEWFTCVCKCSTCECNYLTHVW